MYCARFNTNIGSIFIAGDEKGITALKLNGNTHQPEKGWIEKSGFFKSEIKQLKEYFKGQRQSFDIQLNPKGTEFQKKVWKALCAIPYGETRSYKDIAVAIGKEKASRAVGMANNKNPIGIIIPCHRVIGADGSMTGYAQGVKIKESLLALEGGKL